VSTYRLNTERVTLSFRGDETRHININLAVDGCFEDCVVLTKEDLLWLLGYQEKQIWEPPSA